MTTFPFGDAKKTHQVRLGVSTYSDGNLAIKIYLETHGNFDFWDSLTVNLQGIRPPNHAFINTKSLGDSILLWIEQNNLASPSGQLRQVEGCAYPEYCFRTERLMCADAEGYTYYSRRQKGELGRKYERLYIALKRLAKNVDGFHYIDYSSWKAPDSSSAALPLWIEAEDTANKRQIKITHKGAIMKITVTDSGGAVNHILCRRKEDLASSLLTLFQSE